MFYNFPSLLMFLLFWLPYSLFRLTSLIYAVKLKFENPAIMQDKRCKQTERFSVMGKRSDYFLPLDDKSTQRYKVKFNKIQEYDAYQTKIEELSGDIGKFSVRAVT